MITLHSIDLKTTNEPCFAVIGRGDNKDCRLLRGEIFALFTKSNKCGTYMCPFYKPKNCKDWIRVDDRHSTSIVPPEEYYNYRRREYEQGTGIRK